MNITGGVTFSGSMAIRDQFPIAVAANISAQSLTTGVAITSFNPFASVSAGVAPYVYGNIGALPAGLTLFSGNGLVTGTPTVAQTAATVTFTVADSNNITATVTSAVSFTVLQGPYTVQYLVVAAGGAGGGNPGNYGGGGGGAGEIIASSFTSTPGATYTITIGAGGASGAAAGNNGWNSNIDCPAASLTIQCIGGGGGAGTGYPGTNPIMTGKSGGSGGGGGFNYSPLNSAFPGGGANQYPTGSNSFGPYLINSGGAGGINGTLGAGTCGGGGGALSAGSAGSVTPSSSPAPSYTLVGGAGGSAAPWTYTGSYYGGGGGGGGYLQNTYPGASPSSIPGYGSGVPPSSPAKGGAGDGGGLKNGSMVNATPGTPGTGSGGGGGGGYANPYTAGAAGGSGVVILAVPTPNYSGSAPGASVSTPPAAPGMTVLTYTSSGTYTA